MPGRHVTDQQTRLFMMLIPKGAVSDSFVLSGIPLAALI